VLFRSEKTPDEFHVFVVKTNNHGSVILEKSQNIDNVFCQNKYLTTDETDYDQWFNNMDRFFPGIIDNVINKGIDSLTNIERGEINEFIALQFLRCKAIRSEVDLFLKGEEIQSQKAKYLEFIQDLNIDELLKDPNLNSMFNHLEKVFGKDSAKYHHADVFSDSGILIEQLKELNLDLISPKNQSVNEEFVISGSPVLQNPDKPEFYFPISPSKCLWFHTENSSFPLDVRYLNELQFLCGAGYDGFRLVARSKETLEYLLNNPLTQNEMESLQDSYWKKIIQELKNSDRI
jgi:hypothetical protein